MRVCLKLLVPEFDIRICRHKSVQLQTPGKPSPKAAVTALWGPAALDNVVDLDISFEVEVEKSVVKRLQM